MSPPSPELAENARELIDLYVRKPRAVMRAVFADLILLPQIDLSVARSLTALSAGVVLLWSFIWGME